MTGMDDRAVGVRFVMTSIITDQIGRQKILSPTNHKKLQFPRKDYWPSYERKGKSLLKY